MAFTGIITVLVALLSGAVATAGPGTVAVRQTGCFASPHVCGFPDATNTGVPSGVTLTPSGSVKVTSPGTVISGLEVTGDIEVDADDVTIEDTKVILDGPGCGSQTTCGNYDVLVEDGSEGTVIKNSELTTAPGTTCEHSIRNVSGPDLRIEGVYIHGCDSNLYGGATIKRSFGVAALKIADDHVENVYFNESRLIVLHSTLFNPIEQTAVIFGNSGEGSDVGNCTNHLTVIGSLLAGGGYALYPCAHSSRPGSSYLNVQGNHFARCTTKEVYEPDGGHHVCAGGPDSSGYYPNSGSYGINADYFGGTGRWSGNVWDDNLRTICLDGRTTRRSCRR
jgi:hypothetical protein